jgi:ABC-type multidrug transport system ATPase subunit
MTTGVDGGAKRQICSVLLERAEAGSARVVVSAGFEEAATVCARMLVLRNDLITAEVSGPAITVQRLLSLVSGDLVHIEPLNEREIAMFACMPPNGCPKRLQDS